MLFGTAERIILPFSSGTFGFNNVIFLHIFSIALPSFHLMTSNALGVNIVVDYPLKRFHSCHVV